MKQYSLQSEHLGLASFHAKSKQAPGQLAHVTVWQLPGNINIAVQKPNQTKKKANQKPSKPNRVSIWCPCSPPKKTKSKTTNPKTTKKSKPSCVTREFETQMNCGTCLEDHRINLSLCVDLAEEGRAGIHLDFSHVFLLSQCLGKKCCRLGLEL